MQLELPDETVEAIVCATLKEHMTYLEESIKTLKKKKKLKDFEQQDLGNNVNMLDSMEVIYQYFGGNL